MKKIILLILLIPQALFINAQSLAVSADTIAYGDADVDIESHIKVMNLLDQSIDVVCEKNIISQPPGSTNYFCWAGVCYGSSVFESPGTTTIQAGEISDEFSGHFNAPGCNGCSAVIEYCFYPPVLDPQKECITITYDGSGTASVLDLSINAMSEFYPNPAKEFVNVDYFLNMPAQLIIMDILGNEIKTLQLLDRGVQKINISEFSKGIYFGSLLINNKISTIKKIVVR